MATQRWIGAAQAVPQVNTITPASVGIGNTFNVTINSKTVSFVATAATVANVVAGLLAALQASTIPEFMEITWTANGTSNIVATGPASGAPFTQTSSASGGSATNTTATTTAGTGPNYWNNAANWASGSVPVAADAVVLDNTAVPILYGLAQSAVTLASLTQSMTFTGTVGLPKTNAAGYPEYRPDYLAIGATACLLGVGSGQGSGRIKIDFGSVQTTCEVDNAGSSAEFPLPSVILKGTNASNSFTFKGGSTTAGLAQFLGETAEALNLQVDSAKVQAGAGVTFPGSSTVQNYGGTLTIQSAIAGTLTNSNGTTTITGSGAIATLAITGGTVDHQGTGTITTASVGPGTLGRANDSRALTITNLTMYPGGLLNDPTDAITVTNGVQRGSNVKTLAAA
jgi:hypothetical protein